MTDGIYIEGIDRILAKLPGFRPAVVAALKAGAVHVKGKIAKYPPASDANMPGPYPKRWYQRGYGQKWALKGGAVHGRKTSETMGRRWTQGERDEGLTQIVGNNASYGPYVQGEKQAGFHRQRGWKTTQDVAESEGPKVTRMVSDAIDKVLR
jgi:hypothetical protein